MKSIIPIEYDIRFPEYEFPVKRVELVRCLKLVEDDLEGLCGIQIREPRTNAEFNYFGKYDPDDEPTIHLFAHLKVGKGKFIMGPMDNIELTRKEFRKSILEDTIFHEVGHHVGAKKGDFSEEFADQYAREVMRKIKK